MSKEIFKYRCLKCGADVNVIYLPGKEDKTFLAFKERIDAGLCPRCFNKNKEVVEWEH